MNAEKSLSLQDRLEFPHSLLLNPGRLMELLDSVSGILVIQNDLSTEREQVNELKKYDSVKMKKNLDANKKRLAEKTSAAEVLQKLLGKTKTEKAELLKKVAELEARVAELEPVMTEEAEEESQKQAA